LAAISAAFGSTDVSVWRDANAAAAAERLRRLPEDGSTTNAPAPGARDAASEARDYEVLDFRRYEAEALRYRSARDAFDAGAADSRAARFVVEVRVAVAESAQQAAQVVQGSNAPDVAGQVTQADSTDVAQRLAATAGANAYAAQDLAASRQASLRAQADNAYRAIGQPQDRGSVNVFA
jgi:hypothetical protein